LRQIEAAQESEAKVKALYRSVFADGSGRIVLEDMLWDLYFLRPCQTPEQQALSNYAKELLALIYEPPIESCMIFSLIRKLFNRKAKK
jgi:hypothetical protein